MEKFLMKYESWHDVAIRELQERGLLPHDCHVVEENYLDSFTVEYDIEFYRDGILKIMIIKYDQETCMVTYKII